MTPSPALLHSLRRSRFRPRHASPSVGVGERRSRTKGAGMEFEDYREYQPGDDLRYLDPQLHARLGVFFTRQYAVYQQLPTTVVVDGSASMAFGSPTKFEFARGFAATLAFIALSGGDTVQVGVFTGERLHWSPRAHGAQRAPVIFNWLNEWTPGGSGFGACLRTAQPRLVPGGLMFILSDWWLEDVESELSVLGSLQQEIIGIHVAAPEEIDPASFGTGETRLIDAESGHEMELLIDQNTINCYRRAFAAWQERLRRQFSQVLGRYLLVRSDANLEHLLMRDWRRMGLIA